MEKYKSPLTCKYCKGMYPSRYALGGHLRHCGMNQQKNKSAEERSSNVVRDDDNNQCQERRGDKKTRVINLSQAVAVIPLKWSSTRRRRFISVSEEQVQDANNAARTLMDISVQQVSSGKMDDLVVAVGETLGKRKRSCDSVAEQDEDVYEVTKLLMDMSMNCETDGSPQVGETLVTRKRSSNSVAEQNKNAPNAAKFLTDCMIEVPNAVWETLEVTERLDVADGKEMQVPKGLEEWSELMILAEAADAELSEHPNCAIPTLDNACKQLRMPYDYNIYCQVNNVIEA